MGRIELSQVLFFLVAGAFAVTAHPPPRRIEADTKSDAFDAFVLAYTLLSLAFVYFMGKLLRKGPNMEELPPPAHRRLGA